MLQRLKSYIISEGIRYDIADAVINTGNDNIREIFLKARAISTLRLNSENFVKLVLGQKRVANIIKGQTFKKAVNTQLFIEDTEKMLYKYIQEYNNAFEQYLFEKDYSNALKILLSMRKYIDNFFDDVLVMTEEKEVRVNRLSLLYEVRKMFLNIADFSLIVIEGEEKSD